MENGQHTDNENEMASILNDCFASVFTQEDSSTQLITATALNEVNFIDFIIMESKILHTINKLKVNKTPGPNKISPRILKEVKNEICKPLRNIQ